MTLLSSRRVHFAHPGLAPVLRNQHLDVEAGAVLCRLGRSGCGKTPVLQRAAGLLAPSAGTVSRSGRALVPRDRLERRLQRPFHLFGNAIDP